MRRINDAALGWCSALAFLAAFAVLGAVYVVWEFGRYYVRRVFHANN